jgi:glucan phosphoethanolaminetransferase (alkaline phosphatase superfamily)
MRAFFADYWWLISCAFAGALFFAIQVARLRRTRRASTLIVASVIAAIILAAALIDLRSASIPGPESFSFVSPLSVFSWTIPLAEIVQADLVRARPHNRLNIISRTRSRSLPLTWDLWRKLHSA